MGELEEVIIRALKELLEVLFSPIEILVEEYGNKVLSTAVGAPDPNAVFTAPTNTPWPSVYDYYWETIIPLSLFLWGLAVGLVIFLEATSHLFSGYHRSKLKKRAVTGLLGILSWWWIAALSLQFTDVLAVYLAPDLSDVDLVQSISFAGIGVLGYAISQAVNLTLVVAILLLYIVRHVALYMYVLLMPILIALWIPGVGPFALMSRLMIRLAGFYLPFLFMTVPVAILLQFSGLLGKNFGLSIDGLSAWILALIVPLMAIIAPLILFWQAGAVFVATQRIAGQMSRRRAQSRMARTRDTGLAATQGGRNFSRGLRGDVAVRQDGQYMLGSGGSRAHGAGVRVRDAGSRLSDAITPGGRRGGKGGPGGSTRPEDSRNTSFDTLRPRALPPGPSPDASSTHKTPRGDSDAE
ncbi:hypothetical protein [Haloarchaeobius sp. TZWSO28]|uniref:hypothetical protein n=1 Tax=Haloarchaeobius sp. TZWSO28 TaxID=3446119 RepID=UPI003EC054DD